MLNAYGNIGIGSPSWLVKSLGERAYRETFASLGKVHRAGMLLDIGCGSGEKKGVLPKDASYIGLDHPACLHDKSEIDVFATAYDIPFADGSFDTVFCTGVLEHLEEPFQAISEAFRVLRPGGYGIYAAPLFWHIHEEPRDFYRYTEYGLRYLFEKAGFQIVALKPLSGFWATAGSMFAYYMNLFAWGPLRPLITALTCVSNLICRMLNSQHRTVQFTWMYLVVVKKPVK